MFIKSESTSTRISHNIGFVLKYIIRDKSEFRERKVTWLIGAKKLLIELEKCSDGKVDKRQINKFNELLKSARKEKSITRKEKGKIKSIHRLSDKSERERLAAIIAIFDKKKMRPSETPEARGLFLRGRLKGTIFTESDKALLYSFLKAISAKNMLKIAFGLDKEGLSKIETITFPSDDEIIEKVKMQNRAFGYLEERIFSDYRTICLETYKVMKFYSEIVEKNEVYGETVAYIHTYKILAIFLNIDGGRKRKHPLLAFEKYINSFHKTADKPVHDALVYNIPEKGLCLKYLDSWRKLISDVGPRVMRIFGRAYDIEKVILSEAITREKKLSLKVLRLAESKLRYKRSDKDRAFASVCKDFGVSEFVFDRCLDIITKGYEPDKLIDIGVIDGEGISLGPGKTASGYFFVKIKKGDPIGLILGYLTNCCQSVGGLAESCAVDGYYYGSSGFYAVCHEKKPVKKERRPPLFNKDGRINLKDYRVVGITYIARSRFNNYVFDSFEVIGKEYDCIAAKMICKLAEELLRRDDKAYRVVIGKGGRTPEELRKKASCKITDHPQSGRQNNDARKQVVLAEKRIKDNSSFRKLLARKPIKLLSHFSSMLSEEKLKEFIRHADTLARKMSLDKKSTDQLEEKLIILAIFFIADGPNISKILNSIEALDLRKAYMLSSPQICECYNMRANGEVVYPNFEELIKLSAGKIEILTSRKLIDYYKMLQSITSLEKRLQYAAFVDLVAFEPKQIEVLASERALSCCRNNANGNVFFPGFPVIENLSKKAWFIAELYISEGAQICYKAQKTKDRKFFPSLSQLLCNPVAIVVLTSRSAIELYEALARNADSIRESYPISVAQLVRLKYKQIKTFISKEAIKYFKMRFEIANPEERRYLPSFEYFAKITELSLDQFKALTSPSAIEYFKKRTKITLSKKKKLYPSLEVLSGFSELTQEQFNAITSKAALRYFKIREKCGSSVRIYFPSLEQLIKLTAKSILAAVSTDAIARYMGQDKKIAAFLFPPKACYLEASKYMIFTKLRDAYLYVGKTVSELGFCHEFKRTFFLKYPHLLPLLLREKANPLLRREDGHRGGLEEDGEYYISNEALALIINLILSHDSKKHFDRSHTYQIHYQHKKNVFANTLKELKEKLFEGESAKIIFASGMHAIFVFMYKDSNSHYHALILDGKFSFLSELAYRVIKQSLSDEARIYMPTRDLQKDYYSCRTFVLVALEFFLQHGNAYIEALEHIVTVKKVKLDEPILLPKALIPFQYLALIQSVDLDESVLSRKHNGLALLKVLEKTTVKIDGKVRNATALFLKYVYLSQLGKWLNKKHDGAIISPDPKIPLPPKLKKVVEDLGKLDIKSLIAKRPTEQWYKAHVAGKEFTPTFMNLMRFPSFYAKLFASKRARRCFKMHAIGKKSFPSFEQLISSDIALENVQLLLSFDAMICYEAHSKGRLTFPDVNLLIKLIKKPKLFSAFVSEKARKSYEARAKGKRFHPSADELSKLNLNQVLISISEDAIRCFKEYAEGKRFLPSTAQLLAVDPDAARAITTKRAIACFAAHASGKTSYPYVKQLLKFNAKLIHFFTSRRSMVYYELYEQGKTHYPCFGHFRLFVYKGFDCRKPDYVDHIVTGIHKACTIVSMISPSNTIAELPAGDKEIRTCLTICYPFVFSLTVHEIIVLCAHNMYKSPVPTRIYTIKTDDKKVLINQIKRIQSALNKGEKANLIYTYRGHNTFVYMRRDRDNKLLVIILDSKGDAGPHKEVNNLISKKLSTSGVYKSDHCFQNEHACISFVLTALDYFVHHDEAFLTKLENDPVLSKAKKSTRILSIPERLIPAQYLALSEKKLSSETLAIKHQGKSLAALIAGTSTSVSGRFKNEAALLREYYFLKITGGFLKSMYSEIMFNVSCPPKRRRHLIRTAVMNLEHEIKPPSPGSLLTKFYMFLRRKDSDRLKPQFSSRSPKA